MFTEVGGTARCSSRRADTGVLKKLKLDDLAEQFELKGFLMTSGLGEWFYHSPSPLTELQSERF